MNQFTYGHPPRRDQSGFTLLELLIAMSLLGLIFAALTGGLRFGTHAWELGTEHLDKAENIQIVHRTLRRQLGTALDAPRVYASTSQTSSFQGSRDGLSFVGPSPARSLGAGLFRFTYALNPDGNSQALSLIWHRIGQDPDKAGRRNIEPLLRRVKGIRFTYFGDPDGAGTQRWVDSWQNITYLPRLVRIELIMADALNSRWPAMILSVGGGSG